MRCYARLHHGSVLRGGCRNGFATFILLGDRLHVLFMIIGGVYDAAN